MDRSSKTTKLATLWHVLKTTEENLDLTSLNLSTRICIWPQYMTDLTSSICTHSHCHTLSRETLSSKQAFEGTNTPQINRCTEPRENVWKAIRTAGQQLRNAHETSCKQKILRSLEVSDIFSLLYKVFEICLVWLEVTCCITGEIFIKALFVLKGSLCCPILYSSNDKPPCVSITPPTSTRQLILVLFVIFCFIVFSKKTCLLNYEAKTWTVKKKIAFVRETNIIVWFTRELLAICSSFFYYCFIIITAKKITKHLLIEIKYKSKKCVKNLKQ